MRGWTFLQGCWDEEWECNSLCTAILALEGKLCSAKRKGWNTADLTSEQIPDSLCAFSMTSESLHSSTWIRSDIVFEGGYNKPNLCTAIYYHERFWAAGVSFIYSVNWSSLMSIEVVWCLFVSGLAIMTKRPGSSVMMHCHPCLCCGSVGSSWSQATPGRSTCSEYTILLQSILRADCLSRASPFLQWL